MSFLAPLYALGLLTVAAPILLHLIRRQPRDRVAFSSLLFLKQTPPRLTRRSRINHWFLLLLRILAICGLVLAFARPFMRRDSQELRVELGRRVIVMVDTSASMQRTGLWKRATETVESLVDGLESQDEIALISFDRQSILQVPFGEEAAVPAAEQRQVVLETLMTLAPTNHATELGHALQFAAEYSVSAARGDSNNPSDETKRPDLGSGGAGDGVAADDARLQRTTQLVVVSDMQSGGNLRAIQSYPWPSDVSVELRQIEPDNATNASVRRLPQSEEDVKGERMRVRVDNASSSSVSEFELAWIDEAQQAYPIQKVQVPPGRTRVLSLPMPLDSVVAVKLDGDREDFDNLNHFVQPEKADMEVLYFGSRSEEVRDDLFYYLNLLPLSTRSREVSCRSANANELKLADAKQNPLVVVSQAFDQSTAESLRRYIESGGTVLVVLDGVGVLDGVIDGAGEATLLESLNQLGEMKLDSNPTQSLDANEDAGTASVDVYAMFSSIDYQHSLFASFSDPQFSDFSKIKFWSHENVGGLDEDLSVVATFDDGSPAIIEKIIGKGQLLVMTFGWQPSRSQLALSTKFLPLMDSMVNPASESQEGMSISVGDVIPFPPSSDATISQPDGSTVPYRETSGTELMTQPGIYRYTRDGFESRVAVNLAASESQIEAMDSDEFETLGVRLGALTDRERETARELQLRDRELEEHQGLWQWALIATLLFIFVETLWAGLTSRRLLVDQRGDGGTDGVPSTQVT